MLNSKALSGLFSRNSDRLCKRWFLMTTHGTVLAYSHPADMKDLRIQVALAAMSWQEHQEGARLDSADADEEQATVRTISLLRTLTIETEASNLIIRKLQPQILLVLEGNVPPRKRTFEPRTTPEGPGDAPYPPQDGSDQEVALGSSAPSITESAKSAASNGVLALHRRKLDALASAVAQEFARTGFGMPEDRSTRYV